MTRGIVRDKIVLMRDKKEVREKPILGDNFIRRRSEKEGALECQFVTTS